MASQKNSKFVLLTVLDGWGIAHESPGNAIALAKTPNMDRFFASFPHGYLEASGEAVGLPRGEDGNTETGHLNLGAGRIVYQDLQRINMSIADGSYFKNIVINAAFEHASKYKSKVHLIGLLGAGGVHSNIEHLFALLLMASRLNHKRVYLHLITDGRDSPPTSARTYIDKLRNVIEREGVGIISTIMGRYWAMDRDFRWERTAKAYFALTKGKGNLVKTPEEVINMSYEQGITDEFIEPAIITDSNGNPAGLIQENDSVIFYNFRIDRPRQLTAAFIKRDLTQKTKYWGFDTYRVKYGDKHAVDQTSDVYKKQAFERGEILNNIYFTTMTEYAKPLVEEGAKVAFPPEQIRNPLGRVLSEHGLRQLRISESEKERFVTFYFSGQQELPFKGEERIIIPSPKVPTYDQKPEMKAREITSAVLQKLRLSLDYALILVNFPNPDMVGHTGNIGATAAACEVVDECVGKLANFCLAYGGSMIVTADHGNAEEMINSNTGAVDTEHSQNLVPFMTISKEYLGNAITVKQGVLADIAPTVLYLLGLEIPQSMTGRNLLLEAETSKV